MVIPYPPIRYFAGVGFDNISKIPIKTLETMLEKIRYLAWVNIEIKDFPPPQRL